ncbi:MAG: dTDP-4-dehydrorhamnose 3,5-epimerase [Planctomycetota bacterium]|nr:MAG: dTDP-4-dehydrorhamnose 3,5-epimerase [Planctomycetota bacterium]
MEIIPLAIPDVLSIRPKVFEDNRGFFFESFNTKIFKDFGLEVNFVQDNRALSYKGALRGLHYQVNKFQGKLVSVLSGSVFDVAVDIRPGSSTFGEYVSDVLTGEDRNELYIPPGFAHGYYVISEKAEFFYKCTDYYSPEDERGLVWNDSKVNIDWPIDGDVLINERDKSQPILDDLNLKEKLC